MKPWSTIVVLSAAHLVFAVACEGGGSSDTGTPPMDVAGEVAADAADATPDVPGDAGSDGTAEEAGPDTLPVDATDETIPGDLPAELAADLPGETAGDTPSGDTAADALPGDIVGDTLPGETTDDALPADAADDAVPGDLAGDVAPDATRVTKHFTYRAIGGVSMGAAALTVSAHHPERFDAVGALGGYVDFRYIGHLVKDIMGAGFCPMEQLLQPEVLADIDNPDNPLVFCGNTVRRQPYEFYWDFNHFHFDNDGGTWDRDFYFDVLESLVFANGNFMFYNAENPLLPPGVPIEWMVEPDKCANPARVTWPNNINAEFNPKGDYELISFCDGETQVGCDVEDPTKCGEENPHWRDIRGSYDPRQTYDRPVYVFLAVDYNKNGRRDYGEPIVFNLSERFTDVGRDGCANEFEDGNGGCVATANGTPTVDSNGDDFDLVTHPMGTEGNMEYDGGAEPFEDFGIDGVPEAVSGVKDLGEDDDLFSYNPAYEAMIQQDARTFFNTTSNEQLQKRSYYFEGGVRDALGALTASMHLSGALAARGEEVRRYDNFAGEPTSILPDLACEQVVENLGTVDFSKTAFGRNILMAYGDPDATDEEAHFSHTGKHVGSGCEVMLRPTLFYTTAMWRMPDPIVNDDQDTDCRIEYSSYYSEVLESRRWFAMNLPPGYDREENLALQYPMGIMLPGVGMPLMETVEATRLLGLTQGMGSTPRFVLLAPDGQCCYRNSTTQERFCNCYRISGGLRCVDRDCKGAHSECAVTDIPRDNMVQECNSGHFFFNQKTNRWGETTMETSRFEDALLEVIDVASTLYRVKPAADVEVPADF